ncbi:hypothetical protein LY04_01241 [Oceanimonas baumannii]|uniref:Uncharacterized protein n=1 Tax=Oceanimonas baumannii TaxID=129578 RepID=A0ABY2F167_9GAMM|nr:hypothetical protein LY04_01241 [Oceanimonas baumannii]
MDARLHGHDVLARVHLHCHNENARQQVRTSPSIFAGHTELSLQRQYWDSLRSSPTCPTH